MLYIYESNFAEDIENFILQKHSVGFPYKYSQTIMHNFDKFCAERFPNETKLTKEICCAWAVKKDTENNNAFRNRLMPIREFARYLNRNGIMAYILPQSYAKKGSRPIPHIYTTDEIKSILTVADNLPLRKNYPIRHYVIPTALRLMYCCGLRPCEVRKLQVKNVDLKRGCLFIEESKGHKSRTVFMSDDMIEVCREYQAKVSKILPDREIFFPDSKGNEYTKEWFDKTFRIIREKASIKNVGDNPPRLYDLRHTFATHRLYQWMNDGKDINAMLPYLSAYMGHEQLSDTYYYIHLVPEIFEQMSGFNCSSLESLIPEVESNE